ncbi:MAG: hypothetical protein V9F04_00845 [Dermatophilaceae bacterium]
MSRQAAGREADAFAQALRRAIEARDLPLGRVQRHVERRGVTVGRSTLSYWQNGLRTPSGVRSFQIVEALEEVLHLPSGELTSLILDPRVTARSADEDFDPFMSILGRLDAVGLTAKFRLRSGFTRVRISDAGALDAIEFDVVARARTDVDRFVAIVGTEVGADAELLSPTIVSGGRITRTAVEAEQLGIEIELDEPLRAGEFVQVRYRIDDANAAPCRSFLKFAPRGGILSGLEIEFHPDLLPVTLEQFERATHHGPDLAIRPLTLGSGQRISLIREVQRRGIHGVRWAFESDA